MGGKKGEPSIQSKWKGGQVLMSWKTRPLECENFGKGPWEKKYRENGRKRTRGRIIGVQLRKGNRCVSLMRYFIQVSGGRYALAEIQFFKKKIPHHAEGGKMGRADPREQGCEESPNSDLDIQGHKSQERHRSTTERDVEVEEGLRNRSPFCFASCWQQWGVGRGGTT